MDLLGVTYRSLGKGLLIRTEMIQDSCINKAGKFTAPQEVFFFKAKQNKTLVQVVQIV